VKYLYDTLEIEEHERIIHTELLDTLETEEVSAMCSSSPEQYIVLLTSL